jgi:excisionase family DNA binding protein
MRKIAANNDVMSTSDAAERLGVALRTVQLWVESGVLPAWKTAGGHRRIAKAAVDKLLEERRLAVGGAAVKPATEAQFRILVVEDEPDMLRLLTMVIADWGLPITVQTATNGFEALLRIGEQCPNLLITDLHMPGMDGFQMIRSLQKASVCSGTMGIVVVTALNELDIESRGGLPKEVRVFTKPIAFAKLEELVRAQLSAVSAVAR